MQEVWKDIKGFEGYYQISNYGRLKSFKVNKNGNVLKLTNKKGGYYSVVLSCKGKEDKHTKVHRLVATAFIPNPHNYPVVNHIDGNKQNNNVSNLEWTTYRGNVLHSMNSLHSYQCASMIYYNKHIRPRKVVQSDLLGNQLNTFESAAQASRETGVCSRNILQVASTTPFDKNGRTRKTAGGYLWKFESEVV